MRNQSALAGCRVLYTRDKAHWQKIAPLLRALGAEAVHLPVLSTRRVSLSQAQIDGLTHCSDWVFTSVNAVRHLITQTDVRPKSAIAIGKKTAQALQSVGISPVYVAPAPYTSEALLACWRPSGRKIAIIAAAGGRMVLKTHLAQENAVREVYAYERYCPTRCYHLTKPVSAIVIASQTGLDNLIKISQRQQLKLLQCAACVVAISERVQMYAYQQGFLSAIAAASATEEAQIEGLRQWWTEQQGATDESEQTAQ